MSLPEGDWESLALDWRAASGPVDAAPLRGKVAAHRRRLIAATAGEILLVASFAWLSWLVAGDGVEPWEAVFLTTLWGFTLLAGAFAWWNRRGTWRALGESVEEFVRLTRLRAERQTRSIDFSLGLFAAEAVLIVAQLAWFGRLTAIAGLLLAVAGAVIGAWCWAMKRKVASDLAGLREYDRADTEPSEGAG